MISLGGASIHASRGTLFAGSLILMFPNGSYNTVLIDSLKLTSCEALCFTLNMYPLWCFYSLNVLQQACPRCHCMGLPWWLTNNFSVAQPQTWSTRQYGVFLVWRVWIIAVFVAMWMTFTFVHGHAGMFNEQVLHRCHHHLRSVTVACSKTWRRWENPAFSCTYSTSKTIARMTNRTKWARCQMARTTTGRVWFWRSGYTER